MKILLSPAKKLDFEPLEKGIDASTPVFLSKADLLAKKLNKTSAKGLSSMMNLSVNLTELNKERYAKWNTPEVIESQKPAALSFNGDVYLGLNAPSWSKEDLELSQSKIRILSGLYGILKPLDLIKPYRLEMGSKWKVTPNKPSLYKFWGNKVAQHLESEMEKDELIVNLASAEYSKVLTPHLSKTRRIITAEFREFKNGEYKMIQVFVKKARGLMAKFIIQNNIENSEDLKLFSTDGYQFDANLSTENKLVFTR